MEPNLCTGLTPDNSIKHTMFVVNSRGEQNRVHNRYNFLVRCATVSYCVG